MARIKPDEIKEGDDLQSSTINSTQASVRGVEIAHANIRQEGLTADVIKPNTVFEAPVSISLQQNIATNPTLRSDPSYETAGIVRNNSGAPQYVTVSDIRGNTLGEEVIVRASCRIIMDDYGARTFADCACPIITMGLRYSTNTTGLTPGADEAEYTNECAGTIQSFELAWSGKIPSSSVAYNSGSEADPAFNTAYVGTGGAHDGGIHEFSTVDNTRGMNFKYDFTYQTSWLFSPSGNLDQVHFALFGYAELRSGGAIPAGGGSVGGADGCSVVSYPGFKVRYMHLSAVEVKK